MKKTFKVTVEAKRGALISGSKISSKVWDTEQHFGDFRNVEVEEVLDAAPVAVNNTLYAVGKKVKGEWRLFGFFYSKKRAENALRRSVDNLLRCFIKMEVAILEFSPSMGVWRVVGKPVKA